MPKNKAQLTVQVPVSNQENKLVERLAKESGTSVKLLIRSLLVDRLKAYRAGKKPSTHTPVRRREPSGKEGAGKATSRRTTSRTAKRSLPGGLVPARGNATGSAGAGTEGGAVQHSLPMGG
jgi:hypothetical protein